MGDIPELLPLDNIEALIAALTDYAAANNPRRARQLARLQGYQAPTWKEHFAQVDALLETLAYGKEPVALTCGGGVAEWFARPAVSQRRRRGRWDRA